MLSPALYGLLLHIGGNLRFLRPAESHHAFGAGFLFIGALMTVESLSGQVWHRSRMRTLIFPMILIFLGWGMLAVTAFEPRARVVHLSMGLPMIAGGWAEARSRLENFPHRYADAFIVAGLVMSSIDTVIFHLNGAPTSAVVLSHGGLAIIALIVAALRIYQSGAPQSLGRSLLVSAAVTAIALDLWIDALFQ